MGSHLRNPAAMAVLALVASLGSLATPAEGAISVTFQIVDGEIGGHFGDRVAAGKQLARETAAALNGDQELRYWSFSEGSAFPQLQIRLTKSAATWQYDVALRTDAARAPIKSWTVPWQTEADVDRIGGFPPVARLAAQIGQAFRDQFVTARHAELFAALTQVSLGTAVHLDSRRPELRAVLPLDWGQYSDLGFSEFRIVYQIRGGALIVFGTGSGGALAYPAPPPAQGVAVRLISCDIGGGRMEAVTRHLADIRSGQPVAIFLTKVNPFGGTLSAAGGGLPPPSVARD